MIINKFRFLPASIITFISGIIATPIYSWLLSIEDFGSFIFLWTVASISIAIIGPIHNNFLIRFYSKNKIDNNKHHFFSEVLLSLLALFVLGFLFFYISLNLYFDFSFKGEYFLVVTFVLFFLISETLGTYQRLNEKILAFTAQIFIRKILSHLIAIFLILQITDNIYLIFLSHTLMNFLTIVVYILRNKGPTNLNLLKTYNKWLRNKEINGFIFAMWPTFILALFLDGFDKILIGFYLGPEQLAIYQIAFFLGFTPVAMILNFVSLKAGPEIIAKSVEASKKNAIALTTNYMISFTIISLLALTLYLSLIDYLMNIFDKSYYDAKSYFLWFYFASFLIGLQWFIQRSLQIYFLTKGILIIFFTSSLCSIVLMLILIPILEIKGAAISVMLGGTLMFFLSFVYAGNNIDYFKISIKRDVSKNQLILLTLSFLLSVISLVSYLLNVLIFCYIVSLFSLILAINSIRKNYIKF